MPIKNGTTPYQDAVNKYGGVRKAAKAIGLPYVTFRDRWAAEKSLPPQKPKKIKKSAFTKIVYFCDAHNQPDMDTARFVWLGKFINDHKPDFLIDGGDFDDFQSLCSHEKDDTYQGRLKPIIEQDLSASAKARKLLDDTISHKCKKYVTLGNHEHRIHIYENNNPAMYGMIWNRYEDILSAFGWEWAAYGEHISIAGITFTHVPFNTMGKPVGGDTACKQIADKSLADVVFGHTHKLDIWNSPKFGDSKSTTAFNGGCFMPDGYVPKYAKDTRKEFWYGAHVIMVSDGKIKSIKSWHISELEELYA